ncbi:MAG TPA: type II toxin-antitoxin system RelE/ParE family toxin [Croceibacterium sp.]
MIPVELSEAADADLDSILDYGIAAHGREAAEAYLRLVHATLDRLSELPELGTPRFEFRRGLRSLPVKEHRVFYRFDGAAILVARVLHKAMDVERHL